VRCITKENTIDRPSLKLIQLLPFFKDKTFGTKNMEVAHLGCATMHQLIAGFLEKRLPSWHTNTAHKPTLSQASTMAILGPN
jgi:hypothetical protein